MSKMTDKDKVRVLRAALEPLYRIVLEREQGNDDLAEELRRAESVLEATAPDGPRVKRGRWQAWTETPGQDDTILFEGSKTEATAYFKKHGGSKAGLHLGHDCGPIEDYEE